MLSSHALSTCSINVKLGGTYKFEGERGEEEDREIKEWQRGEVKS